MKFLMAIQKLFFVFWLCGAVYGGGESVETRDPSTSTIRYKIIERFRYCILILT